MEKNKCPKRQLKKSFAPPPYSARPPPPRAAFQQPTTITEGTNVLTYTYSSDYQRIKGVLSGNAGAVLNKRYYFGDFERDITSGVTRDIHYIGADGLNCIIEKVGTTVNYYYVYKDYLGSILTVTNAADNIVEEKNYDAWGKNRNANDWTYNNVAANNLSWLTRGYTGHEHLQQFGLINMNGRLYDPILGRMLSPDNYTQGGSQGYNRYTYAMNNPLKYTDPDGQNPLLIGAGVSILMNGFANLQSGQPFFKGAIEAGVMGLIGAGWSMGIGAAAQTLTATGVSAFRVGLFQAVAHGITGGLMSQVQGGKFWSGAASGAVSSIIGSLTAGYGATAQILAGGLSGGIASSIAGGNFWDGVRQGLITSGLNHALHELVNYNEPPYEYNGKEYTSEMELYAAILADQSMEQLGIKDAAAFLLTIGGSELLSKPFSMEGATKGTNLISQYLGDKMGYVKGRKWVPTIKNGEFKLLQRALPTITKNGLKYTTSIGRFVGRWALPVAVGIFAYDTYKIILNTNQIYRNITSN